MTGLITLPTAPHAEVADLLEASELLVVHSRQQLAKVSRGKVKRGQQQLFDDVVPELEKELAEYFAAFAQRALPVAKAAGLDWDADDIDWEFEEAELTALFGRWYARVGTAAYALVSEEIGVEVSFDLNARGVKRVLGSIAERVTGITETSRERIRSLVETAIDNGYSIEQLVAGVTDDGFGGLRELVAGWASTPAEGSESRAHMIALTETANAYSLSSIEGYRDSGLIDSVEVLDGPDCGWTSHDDPDLAHGSIRSLEDAEDWPTAHPHCQRAFAPVVAR